jgi:co-chaperonin GroES (HSP10)
MFIIYCGSLAGTPLLTEKRMILEPMKSHLLVKLEEISPQGNLVIPTQPQTATVIKSSTFKPGTKVLFGKQAGLGIKTRHGKYLLLADTDILALIQ